MLPNWLYGKSKSKLATALGVPADYEQVKAQVTQNTEGIDELAHKSDLITLSATKNDTIVDNFVVTVRKQYNAIYISGYFNTRVAANRDDLLFTINGLSFLDANDRCYALIMSSSGAISFAEIFSDGTVKVGTGNGIVQSFYIITGAFLVN
ncbi:MAG: hypothetical protein IIW93_05480 [Bacteroidaceae bacterium]|nr:hypothetical protein [Bacteroidaceae bacterium]